MRDRELLLLLLLLAHAADGGDEHSAGLLSRLTSRATGVVVDVVEPDAVIEKVDVNALLDRVDVNALLDRVDVNALMDRVDVDRLMDRVDVQELVDRAGISDIVRESTGALAGSAIDVFRRQVVAIDVIVGNATYRAIGRDPATRPQAPADLEAATGIDETGRGQISGHYAGPVSRLLAFIADSAFMWLGYVLIALGVSFVVGFFTGADTATTGWALVALVVLVSWLFLYNWVSYAIAGKTAGMAIVGLRVLGRDGQVLSGGHAAIRTVVLPISVFFFGLGLIGLFLSPQRRTLHDAAAGSVVVYDWGDRPAEMPAPVTTWVNRHLVDDVEVEGDL